MMQRVQSMHAADSAVVMRGGCHTPGYNLPVQSRGFSLVELLIAMVLSLLLIGGVMQLFVQSKASYTLQDGIARAQENGRLAILFIERHLRRAGYPQDALPITNGFARDKVIGSNDFTGGVLAPVNGATDALVIQLESPPGGITDCTGRTVDAGDFVAMHFLIVDGGLQCESSVTNIALLQSVQLVEGITDMQITYSKDTDKDGVPDSDYLAAGITDLSSAEAWRQVVAVNIEFSVPVLPAAMSGDRVMKFSTTVPIRNQVGRE